MPDSLTIEQQQALAKARARLRLQAQPAAPIGVGEDIVTNALPGAAYDAATGLATLPGNADEMARMVGHWLAEKIAGKSLAMPERPLGGILPSQAQLKERLPITAPEAKTPIGRGVQDVGSLALQTLVMPAAGAKEMVGNAMKFGAGPYMAGKAARGVTSLVGGSEGDKDVAETLAAVGTGGIAAKASKPGMVARTTEEIHDAGSATLKQAKALNITIAQPAVAGIVQRLDDLASDYNAKPYVEKGAYQMLDELRTRRGADLSWSDLMKDRGVLRRIERDDRKQHQGDMTSVGEFAGRMVDEIDKGLGQVDQAHVVGTGSPDMVRSLYKEGNRDWKMYRDAEAIDDAFYGADISAKAARGDKDGAIRDAFRKLAKKGSIERFSPEAQEAILDTVKADKPERAMRFVAKFSPEQRPLMSVVGAGVLGSHLGLLGGLALPVAGAIGNMAAGARTIGQAEKASAIVRGGVQPPNVAAGRYPMLIPGMGNMATQGPQ